VAEEADQSADAAVAAVAAKLAKSLDMDVKGAPDLLSGELHLEYSLPLATRDRGPPA
jgi:hypothetical protein